MTTTLSDDVPVIGVLDLQGQDREKLVGEIARLDARVHAAEGLAALPEACDLIVVHVRAVAPADWVALARTSPIIVVGESRADVGLRQALDAGLVDYLIEPLAHADILRRLIVKVLDLDRLSRAHAESRAALQALNERLEAHLEVLREDQRAGGHVQRKLLPPPGVSYLGVRCDYWFAPSLYLSGDFLDFQRCDDRYSFFYFADVAGHGASSAFVTMLLKYLCNRWLSQWHTLLPEAFPSRWLGELNHELLETGIGKHATIFAGVLDHERRFLHYALGAQLPMPILQTESQTSYLGGEGPPVGLFPDVEYPIYGCPLPESFRLWFFSDGVLECLPEASLDARLKELERRATRCTRVEDLKDGLALGDQLPDDLSMMTLSGFRHD
ncbi:PP2C family protein-serine/threonine phosphatase [Salinicola avicenniae]|uniref:PP2C family protein-serine/threonine phosphatase n=1 Tax=Salinicola avicenniae TaxID=2916836 RepID=UPI002073F400|nr:MULTISPECIES: PP2C family protein-serine/threonine phosphatase [unclassified Salinicola]